MGEAKKKKWRACPAAGREIGAPECGEGRHGQYACPPGCGFDPFAPANYSLVLEMETELDRRSFAALLREDLDAARALEPAADDGGIGLHAATVWRMFFHRDRSGRTFAERWTGQRELKNDQRVMWRGKAATRASFFEVRRILDAERFEVVDLLAAERPIFTVLDRSMGARVARFQTFVTWAYPLPHYWRFSGSGLEVPQHGPHAPERVARETLRHLGAPEGEAAGRWLAENFARVCDALTATARVRRRRMLEAMDARFGWAEYDLKVSLAEALAALTVSREVERDELAEDERKGGFQSALVWFEDADPARDARMPGRRVMGRVLLGKNRAKVEAMGGARLDELRSRLEQRLGPRAVFTKERQDNLGARMATGEPEVDEALVPPVLLEGGDEMRLESSRLPAPPEGVALEDYTAKLREEQRRSWTDAALPALAGKTPREAAGDPALRDRVVAMVKQQILELDRANLRSGRSDDLGWLVRELGLVEIDLPPPPPRPIVPDEEEEEAGGKERPAVAGFAPRGETAPFPARALTLEESIARLDTALERFTRAADAITELEHAGATVLEDMDALTREHLNEDEFGFLVPQVLQVWFALVPEGKVPRLRRDAMAAAFRSDMSRLTQSEPPDMDVVMRITRSQRQPDFVQLVLGNVLGLAEKIPKRRRPPPNAVFAIALALKALIEELDHALRN